MLFLYFYYLKFLFYVSRLNCKFFFKEKPNFIKLKMSGEDFNSFIYNRDPFIGRNFNNLSLFLKDKLRLFDKISKQRGFYFSVFFRSNRYLLDTDKIQLSFIAAINGRYIYNCSIKTQNKQLFRCVFLAYFKQYCKCLLNSRERRSLKTNYLHDMIIIKEFCRDFNKHLLEFLSNNILLYNRH